MEVSSTFLSLPARGIHELLLQQAARDPMQTAFEFGEQQISYGYAAVCARRFASALRQLGVEKGDRIGIMLPNRPEFLFAYYGALMSGAVVVLVNVMLMPDEIEYLAHDSGMKVLVTHRDYLDRVREGAGAVKSLKHLIVVDGEDGDEAIAFAEALEMGEPDFHPADVELNDLAMLVYTSGTTGKPKGAMISHSNVLHNLAAIREMRSQEGPARTLCVLPLFHVYGLVALVNFAVLKGDTIRLHPRFEAEPVIDALMNKNITHFSGTPTMYFHILNHPKSQGATFPALQRCGAGGAPLPLEIRRAFEQRFGVDITEGYGLSETTVSVSGYPEGMFIRSGSVGVPIPGMEVKIVNEEGEEERFGEVGEVLVHGPNVMQGYWNRPEETDRALKGGWLHTGDLGYIDDKGFLFIIDRMKDMIIKGGYNIYPREIEEVIYQLPEVDMAAVFGIPDPARGEEVQAVVSLKQGRKLSSAAIMDHLRKKLAKYKLPRSVTIVDALPTGPTGKILKRELRDRWDDIGKRGD